MQISVSKQIARFLILAGLMSAALPALAHVDASHAATGFGSGFMHPLLGLDHLLAMLAVGIWAATQKQRSALWLLPVVFPFMMAFGAMSGVTGMSLAGVELGIAVSVALLGLLIAFAIKLPTYTGACLVAFFGLMHGYAHGIELPVTGSALAYGSGFMLSTLLIHIIGIVFCLWNSKNLSSSGNRLSGAGIAAMGLFFLAGLN